MPPTALLSVLVYALILLSAHVEGMAFTLSAKKQRCFTQEIPTGVDLTFNYVAKEGYAQYLDVKISDPLNRVIWEEIATDRGSFSTVITRGGDYAFCFYSRLVPGMKYQEGMSRKINMEIKTGTENEDYTKLATKEHLKPLEINLRIMEDTVRSIHGEYIYYKEREVSLRNTNEYINTRASWARIVMITAVVIFGWFQVRHLKGVFRKKRMID